MLGLLAKKVGMTWIPGKNGEMVPVTVLDASQCFVLDVRKKERDGYDALRLAFGKKKSIRLNRPTHVLFKSVFGELKEYPASRLREFKVDNPNKFSPGTRMSVNIFKEGEKIDVAGISKGRGFSGGVKRWGFRAGPHSHGSKSVRRPGSIGQTTDPGRVWKGKKMPGHYGAQQVTIHNLEVVKCIEKENLIMVKGSVPGPNGSIVEVCKAKRIKA